MLPFLCIRTDENLTIGVATVAAPRLGWGFPSLIPIALISSFSSLKLLRAVSCSGGLVCRLLYVDLALAILCVISLMKISQLRMEYARAMAGA